MHQRANFARHVASTRPVPPEAIVSVDLGDGEEYIDRADAFYWGAGEGEDEAGRIRGFRVLSTAELTQKQRTAIVRDYMAELGVTLRELGGRSN